MILTSSSVRVQSTSIIMLLLLVLVFILEQRICHVSCWITTTSTINTLSVPYKRVFTQHNTLLLSQSGSRTTGSRSIRNTGIHHLFVPNNSINQQKRSVLHQLSSSTTDNNNNNNNNNILATSDLTNKIIYQRVFYSLCTGSDVDIIKSIVIEERKRYIVDPTNSNRLLPIGSISLILRNGNTMDDNEIGTDFYTMNLPTTTTTTTSTSDPMYETSILTALYLASNPLVCTGQLLHVGIDTSGGFGTILGCIGASYVLNNDNLQQQQQKSISNSNFDNDILTINTKTSSLLPNNLDRITLTDENNNNLDIAMNYCSLANIKESSKLLVEQLQWRIPSSSRSSSSSSSNRNTNFMGLTDNFNSNVNEQRTRYKEYNTIIACGLDYTYPEAKEMARTIANRVECISRNRNPTDSSTKLPRFLNIFSEKRSGSGSGVSYLRSFLEKGYKMSTSMEYIKLEKLVFQYQIVPIDQVSSTTTTGTNDNINNNINYTNEESVLDELELELVNVIESNYQTLVSIHHPDYIGGGSGEYFFPMDTGEYDSIMSSSSQLSPQTDPKSW